MGNYEQLKQSVSAVIKTNGNQEITGSKLQNVLLTIISTVGANATFAGIATPSTNPGTPDGPVFYIASESGTYSNFGSIELDAPSVLMWNGTWSSHQIFSVDNRPTAGSDNLIKSGGVAVVEKLARGIANVTWEKKNIAGNNSNIRLTSSLIAANVGDNFLFSCSSGYVASVFAIKSNNTYTSIIDSQENGTFVIPSDYIGFKVSLRTNPDGGNMSLNDWNKFLLYKDIFNASKANSDISALADDISDLAGKVLFNNNIIKRNQVASFSDVTWEKKTIAGADSNIRLTSSLIPGSAGDVFVFSAKDGYAAYIYSFKENNTYTEIANSLESTSFSLPADSVGFKVSLRTNPDDGNMSLNDWNNVRIYADVANILHNISSLSTKTEVLEKSINKIVLGSEVTWENKNIAGTGSNVRLTSSLIPVIAEKEYILDLRDADYCFSVFVYTDATTYTTLISDVNNCTFIAPDNIVGFKVSIRHNPDGPSVSPTIVNSFDAFINQFQKKNGFIHLKLGSYNVWEYANPSIFPEITTELRDSWIDNFKHMMNTLGKADILFTQEDNTVYKYLNTQDRNAYNDLYKQMFPYKYCCGSSLPSIYSKYKLYNGRTITINVDTGSISYTRRHAFAEINIEGKKIALLSIHGGIRGEEGLRAEFSAIISELSNYGYVIIGGDTNADAYNGQLIVPQPVGYNPIITDTFGEAGYQNSNYGYWGNFKTWREPFEGSVTPDKCVDTFLTKGISICSFDVLTNSNQKDHYPIVSDVTLSFD